METFFDTIYYYTNGLYGVELDNYLYDNAGYVHVGISMLIISSIMSFIFYWIFKPVRNQMRNWSIIVMFNAITNLLVALWYTLTPLINNEIDLNDQWLTVDCFGFGISNMIWSFIAFIIISIPIKWWSPAKYVPFQKF